MGEPVEQDSSSRPASPRGGAGAFGAPRSRRGGAALGDVAAIAARLRTVESAEPKRLIGEALEALLETGDADEAHFYRPAVASTQPMTARWEHVGSERARRALARFHAEPPIALLRGIGSSAWEPAKMKPGELEDFLERKELCSDPRFHESGLFREFLAPADLFDFQRLLVARGGQLAGWIGLFRSAGAPPFSRADRCRLRPLVAPISALLTAAARLDALGPDAPGDLVVRSDGHVEFASADAKQWLGFRGFAEALRRRVQDFDRGLAPEPVFVLDAAAEASVLRLDGPGGAHYLVTVRPLRGLEVPEFVTALTAAEREVAELAAHGATAAEIARLRGTTAGTAKNQIKGIYRALGVTSRVALLRVLGES